MLGSLPGMNAPACRLCDGPPSSSNCVLPQLWQMSLSARAYAGTQGSQRDSRQPHDRCIVLCSATATADAPIQKATRVPSLPFVKVAGQEEMKLALLLNVVDPGIGGVLIMGDRGTGKSVCVSLSHFCSPLQAVCCRQSHKQSCG